MRSPPIHLTIRVQFSFNARALTLYFVVIVWGDTNRSMDNLKRISVQVMLSWYKSYKDIFNNPVDI